MNSGTVRRLKAGGWIADITINGQRHQLKAPTKAAALARLREAREGAPGGKGRGGKAQGFPLSRARALSLEVRWRGKPSERSMAIYSRTVVEFFGADHPLEGIGAPEVERLRQHLASKGLRPATINHHVSAIRSMQSDALLHGQIAEAQRLPAQLRVHNAKDRIFSAEEVSAITTVLERLECQEAAALLIFLVETGARCGETLALRGEDIVLKGDSGTVRFPRPKNGKPRTIPLTARARSVVAGRVGGKGVPVWSLSYDQLRRQFERARDLVGLEDSGLTLHSARHTCCSRLAQRGISLPQIMRWSGHTSLASVQRYMHVDLAALNGALAALDGEPSSTAPTVTGPVAPGCATCNLEPATEG